MKKRTLVSVFILMSAINVMAEGETAWESCGGLGLSDEHYDAWKNVSADIIPGCIYLGANVNAFSRMTPLGMSLLSRSRTEVVQALLDAGANVNQRAGTGVPPIFYALPRGLPMVEMLINAGADVTVLDPSGQTVLHWAVGANYLFRHEVVEILEILLANGADINGQDIWGETPLIRAVRFKNTHAIMTLIERGADPTIKENEGRTALDLANEHEELRATEAYWRLNDLRNDQN